MQQNWLWDRRLSLDKAKEILKDSGHKRFVDLSALLLSRNNSAREVFKEYISKKCFALNWNKIKRQMRKNNWNEPRIEYWQAVYENLKEKIKLPKKTQEEDAPVAICKDVGSEIESTRKKTGLTQRQLAKKLKISQQIISRIESGRQNITLVTLYEIAAALGSECIVKLGQRNTTKKSELD